jgi:DNA mismatch repair protein MutS
MLVKTDKLTPMMEQYLKLKKELKDAILFFRLGDFYEMFFEDAKLCSRILQIALTSRVAGKGRKIPMCGVPHHAVENYLNRLLRQGYKVGICEQVEDPAIAKGLVRRAITRIVTPGTVLSPQLLEAKENNYLMALCGDIDKTGIAFVDLSTGDFRVGELDKKNISDELACIRPRECLLGESGKDEKILKGWRAGVLTKLEDWIFIYERGKSLLEEQFGVVNLDGFGISRMKLGVGAAGAIVHYLRETQKAKLGHLKGISIYSQGEHMIFDRISRRNLELTRGLSEGGVEGSLVWVIDETITPMGGRKIRQWLGEPLLDVSGIRERQDAVEEFFKKDEERYTLRKMLEEMSDLERLVSRLSCQTANARDMSAIKKTLSMIAPLREAMKKIKAARNMYLRDNLDEVGEVKEIIEKAIKEEPSPLLKEGGIIREGYNKELDELHNIKKEGKGYLSHLEEREIKRTGINSLKVKFNSVFGYYIEVSKPNLHLVPPDYIRKQTMVNAERFITPELKEYEVKVLEAEDRIKALEYEIFCAVRDEILRYSSRLQRLADIAAEIDVVLSLAEVARKRNYTRPEVTEEGVLHIEDGRHPILEKVMGGEKFIPNDSVMDTDENSFLIITGPNMAGKSTYIRQVALLVILSQMGSFIPAKKARIGICDRIFTRVGASDDLARGRSTFLVEMSETAHILNNATRRSLLILDEIGRGTSTFDGISIAWAVSERLCRLKCRTLCATHYHELTALSDTQKNVKNYSVAVREWNDEVVFLHKVQEGTADKSYGIHVARIAGVPQEVIKRSREILTQLESGSFLKKDDAQLELFEGGRSHPALERLKNIKPDDIAPKDALALLYELIEKAREE